MNRILIIDGSNLLFQMFFGMPARIVNKQGKAIQGTLGFVGALLKIIRKTEPTHIAVFFDGEHENIRRHLTQIIKLTGLIIAKYRRRITRFRSCRMYMLHLIISASNMQKQRHVKLMTGLRDMLLPMVKKMR